MIFWNTFKNSLKLPKKKAMFELNKTGMDIALIYLFFLTFLLSIPEFFNRASATGEVQTNIMFLAIYFFIFYYIPLTIMILLSLSLVSYGYTKIAEALQRKLRFQIIWKLTAYSITIPIFIFTLLQWFFSLNYFTLMLMFLWTTIFILRMIFHFPKYKRRIKKE